MTTNHRPTLESKRGKAGSISNTIYHSRSLPQHTSLKYRSDIRKPYFDTKAAKQAVEELKKDLLTNEGRLEDSTKFSKPSKEGDLLVEKPVSKAIGDQEDEQDNSSQESDDQRSITQEEYSSSDDDSEDETAQLMEELARIKNERLEEKEKLEFHNKINKTKVSNPLVQVSGTTNDNFKIKKSWRNTTAFKRQNSKNESDDESFTNDTLNSDFHQKFLTKYIR